MSRNPGRRRRNGLVQDKITVDYITETVLFSVMLSYKDRIDIKIKITNQNGKKHYQPYLLLKGIDTVDEEILTIGYKIATDMNRTLVTMKSSGLQQTCIVTEANMTKILENVNSNWHALNLLYGTLMRFEDFNLINIQPFPLIMLNDETLEYHIKQITGLSTGELERVYDTLLTEKKKHHSKTSQKCNYFLIEYKELKSTIDALRDMNDRIERVNQNQITDSINKIKRDNNL